MTYEEANWATLSPGFRAAHNRLRQAKGLPTIPPPAIDLYVPRRAAPSKPFDPSNAEFVAAVREFHGGAIPGAGFQGEGFAINGQQISFGLNDMERAQNIVRRQSAVAQSRVDEGFKINGRVMK